MRDGLGARSALDRHRDRLAGGNAVLRAKELIPAGCCQNAHDEQQYDQRYGRSAAATTVAIRPSRGRRYQLGVAQIETPQARDRCTGVLHTRCHHENRALIVPDERETCAPLRAVLHSISARNGIDSCAPRRPTVIAATRLAHAAAPVVLIPSSNASTSAPQNVSPAAVASTGTTVAAGT